MAASLRPCLRTCTRRTLSSVQRRCVSGSPFQQPDTRDDHGEDPFQQSQPFDQPRQQLSRRPLNTANVFGPSLRSPQKKTRDPPPNLRPGRAERVELDVDGNSHQFSPILLRDLCECTQCVDPSTNQKNRLTTEIPASIRPRAIAQDENGVSILWDDDVPGYGREHSTDISINSLREYVRSGDQGLANYDPGPRNLWDAEEYKHLPDMSYEEYMQSDSALYRMLQQLHTHGLAFLTDVPGSEKSVSDIAERIGPIKNTFYGYTWDVRSVPESKNVAYTSQDLGFHMDLLYMEQPPHLQFLHCIRSSSVGGASLFTDSFRSAADLLEVDENAFGTLKSSRVNFHYNHPSSALYQQRHHVLKLDNSTYKGGGGKMLEAYRRAKKGAHARGDEATANPSSEDVRPIAHLKSVAWSPPFQGPFGAPRTQGKTQTPLAIANDRVEKFHGAAGKFNELIHRPEMIYERVMKPGECVLFDNRRVLHARKAFEVGDVGKERWLRGAYLDRDPYLSRMRVLARKFGNLESAGVSAAEGKVEHEDYFEAAAATA